MDEKDIERIMSAEFPVPDSCNKASDKALAQIKTDANKASASDIKNRRERTQKLPIAGVAAILAVAIVCAGEFFTQQHANEATPGPETIQEAVDYRSMCQSELDKLKSLAGKHEAASTSSSVQSSAAADSTETEEEQLSERISDYEDQLNDLVDEESLRELYERIRASVEDCE